MTQQSIKLCDVTSSRRLLTTDSVGANLYSSQETFAETKSVILNLRHELVQFLAVYLAMLYET